MRPLRLALLWTFAIAVAPAAAQEKKPYPTIGTIERLDPRFDKLIPKDAKLEKVAGGFIWTEGPVWVRNGGYLLFTDIPNNVVNKWKEGEKVVPFIKPSGYTGKKPRGGKPADEPGANGLRTDVQGRLHLCEHGDRRVSRIDLFLRPDTAPLLNAKAVLGKKTVLADKYMGKRLNSPNDLVFHSNGDIYFTDPPYGLLKREKDPARELDFFGVYRISAADGKLTLLTKEMTRPNGIALSPDDKTLYVANSDPELAIWKAFAVKADGTLGEGKVFFDASKWVGKKKGLPDGLRVDVDGNLFATGPGGVLVFAPDGTHLGTIATGVPTSNCTFGEDGSVLFVTANHDIGRIRTGTKGLGFE
jgi:gluconolactonase